MATRRAAARSVAAGQAAGTVAVPLALHVSARIAERDAEEFVYDPTQLANALRDLIDAVDPDGVPVCDPDVLLAGCRTARDILTSGHLKAAVEATGRLRTSYGDDIVLVAILPGPVAIARHIAATGAVATDIILTLGKEFLGAGADMIVVHDEAEVPDTSLTTLANVARFHQAAALSHAVERYGLPATVPLDLYAPAHVPGVALTPRPLARDTDISVLRDWVAAVRALGGGDAEECVGHGPRLGDHEVVSCVDVP
jgi:hypothetical protein